MSDAPPFALFIRGPQADIFDLADLLGFDAPMEALAVSIFEDDPNGSVYHLQALYSFEMDAKTALNSLAIGPELEAFVTQLPDIDWVAKSQKGLPPVEAGRFWIYGEHDRDKIPSECPWPIHIEAGPAFGTGHHGTTKGCLLIFDEMLIDGETFESILDLGCGAGTLAIAAAMALSVEIEASDIDPDAVTVTSENADQNNVGDKIKVFQADGFDSDLLRGKTYDLIFANILAGPLMGLAPEISNALKPGGKVILSGILDELADQVAAAFKAESISIKKGPSLSGWTSLQGEKIV